MKNICLLVACALQLTVKAGGDEFTKKDNWLNLLAASKMNLEKFKLLCPHFPNYVEGFATKEDYNNFVKQRYEWFRAYPHEVSNFMSSPEIKAIHPAPGDLGLDEMLYRPKIMQHPLWQRFYYAYISDKELATFAPHFPKPLETSDSAHQINLYMQAVADWKILFEEEWIAFNNHPKLIASSGVRPGEKFNPVPQPEKDRFKRLPLTFSSRPALYQLDTGNPALDKAREQAYQKKYTYENNKMEYYRLYEPEGLRDYLKTLPAQQGELR